jgi:ribonuclease G
MPDPLLFAQRRPAATTKRLLLECGPHETRLALLENDRLAEILIEREQQRGIVGNVYKGRVNRVLPGMQAAFVDIGLARDAFLFVKDVAGQDELVEDEIDEIAAHEETRSIEQLIEPGQQLLVQVRKEALANKGARLTTQITLPGRYLVLLPTVRHFGVSRRIEDEAERQRLRTLLEGLDSGGMGLILRTLGGARQASELAADLAYLRELWANIEERAAAGSAPALLHRDQDLALRAVRDLFDEECDVLWVEGKTGYERICDLLANSEPGLLGRVRLVEDQGTLFERFDIEREIEAALEARVWLDSGGYLIIHPTEALVAIDVNSGRNVGQESLEKTALQTNLEAVREAVRQIRLRDLSGIIVLDLIDMVAEENRRLVFSTLEAELRSDRAKSRVLEISAFGLVQITRKRSHSNLERLLLEPCPHCRGQGRIRTPITIALDLRRALLRRCRDQPAGRLILQLHPDVAAALRSGQPSMLAELESTLAVELCLEVDAALERDHFEIREA